MKGIKVCDNNTDMSFLKGGETVKTQYIILGLIAIILVGGFFFITSQSTKNVPPSESYVTNQEVANAPLLSTRYVDYSSDNLAKATANNGRVVLFFAALKWCPSCQVADRDFKANFDKLPKDITILKVDYDTATELKQKYAITIQDTFVQVDNQGKEITRWNSGGQGVQALLANAK